MVLQPDLYFQVSFAVRSPPAISPLIRERWNIPDRTDPFRWPEAAAFVPRQATPCFRLPGNFWNFRERVGRSEGTEPRPSQETPVLTERFQENLWQVRICYQFVRNTPIGGYPRFSFCFRVRMNDLGILLKCRFCGSVGLDRGPGRCISNELPGDVKLLVRGAHAELGPGGECGGASRGGTVARSAGVADGPDPPACRAGGAQNAQRARGAIRTDFGVP